MTRIGFSTLGCPEWPIEKVLEHAKIWGVDCLEIRVLDGRIVKSDMVTSEIDRIARLLSNSCIAAETLASSVKLAHGPDQVEELCRLLDIAAAWDCRRVRAFVGTLPDGVTFDEHLGPIMTSLEEALACAARLHLEIGLETHDSISAASDAARIVAALPTEHLSVIWDTVHTTCAGETPNHSWRAIGAYVREIQVKDARRSGLTNPTPTLLDEGDVPWREAVAIARGDGFDGAYMLEWEKAWYPELPEPEVAMPHDLSCLRSALCG